jgi:hypothetical protein
LWINGFLLVDWYRFVWRFGYNFCLGFLIAKFEWVFGLIFCFV